MEKIQHNYVDVRGLKLHIAEIGTGPAVLFLHGFPEIWYSWRHQMIAVADAGFRAIAPDFRGYGLSELPAEPEKTTFRDLVDDLRDMLDSLGLHQVFLVGKDFGARVAYHFALVYPDRVSTVVTLGVPFLLTGPETFPRDLIPNGFYMLRWQEPGRAEKDFGRFDTKTVVKKIYIMFSGSELPIAKDDEEIMDLVDPSAPLPDWFTEEDLANYAPLYEKSSLRTALQVPYRIYPSASVVSWNGESEFVTGTKASVIVLPKDAFGNNISSARAWLEEYGVKDIKVKVPCLLVMGEKDYSLKFGGLEQYVKSGMVKEYVPNLETIFLPEGSHFVQEQFPEQVNQLIITFLNKLLASDVE